MASLLDFLSLTPEQYVAKLWQQERKYPWIGPNGQYIEETIKEPVKGPVIPAKIGSTLVGVYSPKEMGGAEGGFVPGFNKIAIKYNPTRSNMLVALNHELEHKNQFDKGYEPAMREALSLPYDERPHEAQAKIVGNMSSIPREWQDFYLPTQLANNLAYNYREFDSLGRSRGNPIADEYSSRMRKNTMESDFHPYMAEKMQESNNNWNTLKKMSLIDALMSLK